MQEVKMLQEEIKQLERIIEILDQEGVEKCEKLEKQAKQIKQLEKALDKACKELTVAYAHNVKEFQKVKDEWKYIFEVTKEEWKELLLKEVQEDE